MQVDVAMAKDSNPPEAREAALRVLHVIDPQSPGGGACTLRLLADLTAAMPAWDHRAVIAGRADHRTLARRCGVSVIGAIPAPVGRSGVRLAARALRSVLAAYEEAHGSFDLMQAWTIASAHAAREATSRRPLLATIQVGPVDEAERRALRRFAFSGGTLIVATSSSSAGECLDFGVPRNSVVRVPAGVRLQRTSQCSRAELRKSWNARDHEFLVGLISQPSTWSDVRMALAIVAPLMAVPHPIRLVAFPDASRRVQAMRWIRRLDWPEHIILDDDLAEPWRVVHGLDAVLALGGNRGLRPIAGVAGNRSERPPRMPSTGDGEMDGVAAPPAMGVLPILHSMGAGLPVITDIADDELTEIVVDGRSGFRVHPSDLSAAMERVLRLLTDAPMRRRMGVAAREAVMTHATMDQFAAGISALAGRLMLASTAGPACRSAASIGSERSSRTGQRASA